MKTGPKPAISTMRTPPPPAADLLIKPEEPPSWCATEDAQTWWTLSQCLIDRGQLTRGDLPLLEAFVLAKSMIDLARQEQRWRDCDKFSGTLARLSRELGLSPSARETMRPAPTELDLVDDLARFKASTGDDLEPWRPERRDVD